jgi:hypothetical protein
MTPVNNKVSGNISLSNAKKKIPMMTLTGLIGKVPKTRIKLNLPSTGESP